MFQAATARSEVHFTVIHLPHVENLHAENLRSALFTAQADWKGQAGFSQTVLNGKHTRSDLQSALPFDDCTRGDYLPIFNLFVFGTLDIYLCLSNLLSGRSCNLY